MDKQQIVSFIQGQLAAGRISAQELMSIAQGGDVASAPVRSMPGHAAEPVRSSVETPGDSSKKITHIFYAIGAIIAIVGVGVLIAQNWQEIGFLGRVVVTAGISLTVYVAGLLLRSSEQRTLSQVMFTISAALAPLGAYVFLNETNIQFTWNSQIGVASALFVIYGVAWFVSKRNILSLVTIGFATWGYMAFVLKISADLRYDSDVLKWAIMLAGVVYILLGWYRSFAAVSADAVDARERRSITRVLYAAGTLALLGAGIFVGGAFDLVYILLIFGCFYGSVYLKSTGMLGFAAIFLMAHIVKLTSEYFVDSIGWPIALIAIGFLVIGIGYATFYLNKKFISSQQVG